MGRTGDRRNVARNIWESGSFKTLGYGFPDTHASPHFSIYSAGLPILLVPFWVLQAHHDLHGAQWMTVANPLLLAACGAVLYRVGIALRMSRSTAVGMAFVFGALTMAPMYSTDLFAEPGVTLGATLALLGCIQWRNGKASGPWCIGVGIAVRDDVPRRFCALGRYHRPRGTVFRSRYRAAAHVATLAARGSRSRSAPRSSGPATTTTCASARRSRTRIRV